MLRKFNKELEKISKDPILAAHKKSAEEKFYLFLELWKKTSEEDRAQIVADKDTNADIVKLVKPVINRDLNDKGNPYFNKKLIEKLQERVNGKNPDFSSYELIGLIEDLSQRKLIGPTQQNLINFRSAFSVTPVSIFNAQVQGIKSKTAEGKFIAFLGIWRSTSDKDAILADEASKTSIINLIEPVTTNNDGVFYFTESFVKKLKKKLKKEQHMDIEQFISLVNELNEKKLHAPNGSKHLSDILSDKKTYGDVIAFLKAEQNADDFDVDESVASVAMAPAQVIALADALKKFAPRTAAPLPSAAAPAVSVPPQRPVPPLPSRATVAVTAQSQAQVPPPPADAPKPPVFAGPAAPTDVPKPPSAAPQASVLSPASAGSAVGLQAIKGVKLNPVIQQEKEKPLEESKPATDLLAEMKAKQKKIAEDAPQKEKGKAEKEAKAQKEKEEKEQAEAAKEQKKREEIEKVRLAGIALMEKSRADAAAKDKAEREKKAAEAKQKEEQEAKEKAAKETEEAKLKAEQADVEKKATEAKQKEEQARLDAEKAAQEKKSADVNQKTINLVEVQGPEVVVALVEEKKADASTDDKAKNALKLKIHTALATAADDASLSNILAKLESEELAGDLKKLKDVHNVDCTLLLKNIKDLTDTLDKDELTKFNTQCAKQLNALILSVFVEKPEQNVLENFRTVAQGFIEGLDTSIERKKKIYNALTGILTTVAVLTGFIVGGIAVTLLTGGALTLPYILGATAATLGIIGGTSAGAASVAGGLTFGLFRLFKSNKTVEPIKAKKDAVITAAEALTPKMGAKFPSV